MCGLPTVASFAVLGVITAVFLILTIRDGMLRKPGS